MQARLKRRACFRSRLSEVCVVQVCDRDTGDLNEQIVSGIEVAVTVRVILSVGLTLEREGCPLVCSCDVSRNGNHLLRPNAPPRSFHWLWAAFLAKGI
jgi:hypothetical protein